MAPEVLKRGSTYDELVDIWSLGVMIYQMLYGRAPFLPKNGNGMHELLTAIE
jgi:serine/threonine protein kinase